MNAKKNDGSTSTISLDIVQNTLVQKSFWNVKSTVVWLALGMFAAGILLTWIGAVKVQQGIDLQLQQEFEFVSNEIKNKILSRLHAHAQILRSGSAFIEGSESVTRKEWRAYIEHQNIDNILPGIQGIGYSAIIPQDQLTAHEQTIRREGFPQYSVRPAGTRDLYTSIIYLEPFSGRNMRAFGYDMFSEPVRRKAMEYARDYNTAALSGKITLVQETDRDVQAGTLMYVSVYDKNMSVETIDERRTAIRGWVYSPYRMNDLMEGILGGYAHNEKKKIHLEIYDDPSYHLKGLLYDSNAESIRDTVSSSFHTVQTSINFNEHVWYVRFMYDDHPLSQIDYSEVWIIAIAGTGGSILITILFIVMMNTKNNAQRMADVLTKDLKESEERWNFALEGSGDGVWDWNAQTNQVYFSSQWKTMLGYSDLEIGSSLDEWRNRIHPDDEHQVFEDLNKHLQKETPVYQNEHRVQCKDGTYKWISDRGKVIQWTNDGTPQRVIGTHSDITERIQAEQKLRISDAALRSVSQGLIISGPDQLIHSANDAFSSITGYSRSEILGSNCKFLQGPLTDPTTVDEMRQAIKQAVHFSGEILNYRKDGTPFWNDLTISPVLDEQTRLTHFIGVIRDISERKLSEETLSNSEARYRRLFETSKDGILILDAHTGKIVDVNPFLIELLGYSRTQFIEKSIWEIGFFKDIASNEDKFFELQQKEYVRYEDLPLETADGNKINVEFISNVYTVFNRKVIQCNIRDITKRKQAEDSLREVEQNYRTLADSGRTLVWTSGTDTRCNYFNNVWLEFTGRTVEQEMGNGWVDGVHPDDLQHCLKIYTSAFDRREDFTMEYRLRRFDGEYRWILDDGILRKNSAGEFIGYIGHCYDITDRKYAEEQIKHLANELHVTLNTVTAGISHIINRKIVWANKAHDEMFGYRVGETQGSETAVLYEDRSRFEHVGEEAYPQLTAGKTYNTETHMRKKDGTIFWCNLTGNLVDVAQPEHGSIWMVHDVTDRKNSEESLRHAQKLESIGTLAAGIAHDFNNLLVGILGQASLALKKLPKDSPAAGNIQKSIKASEHAADLVRQLLAYSGKGKFFMTEIDLNTLILENLQIFEVSIPKTAELRQELISPPPQIIGDRGQIQQVIMNLIINAGEAMGTDPGFITVRTKRMTLSEQNNEYVKYTNNPLAAGTYAMIQVIDSGIGMKPEVLSRIFDPFFTTKFLGRGLGLPAVLGIIRGHHGGLRIESEEGKGTMFEIVLPLMIIPPVNGVPLPANEKMNQSSNDEERKTILIIDDDQIVFELLKDVLTETNFTVIGALDPLKGIELYRQHHQSISLVILDFSMPRLNGKDTFEELLRIKKDIKVLLCSGYNEEETMANFDKERPIGFLKKPYQIDTFLDRVLSILKT